MVRGQGRGNQPAPTVTAFDIVYGLLASAMEKVYQKKLGDFRVKEACEDVRANCRTILNLAEVNPYVKAQAKPASESLLLKYVGLTGRRPTEAVRELAGLYKKLGGKIPSEIKEQVESAY